MIARFRITVLSSVALLAGVGAVRPAQYGHTGACAAVSAPCAPADIRTATEPQTGAQQLQTNEQQENRP